MRKMTEENAVGGLTHNVKGCSGIDFHGRYSSGMAYGNNFLRQEAMNTSDVIISKRYGP